MKKFLFILLLFSCILTKAQNACFGWAKGIGSSSTGDEVGESIKVDASGNSVTTGRFRGTVDFDPGPGSYTLASAGGDDAFVVKLDPNGNFMWAIRIGNASNEEGTSLAIDGSGNIVFTGTFIGNVDFDPGPGTFNLNPSGSSVFVCKLDPNGNFVWAKPFAATGGNNWGYGIAVDASNNIITTGRFNATVDFDPSASIFNLSPTGSWDIFVAKIDPLGNLIWAKKFGGSSDDYGYAVDVDAAGNVFTTGYYRNTVDFDPNAGVFNLIATVTAEVFVSKLDVNGDFVWAKSLGSGGGNPDYGRGIKVDASSNVFITGFFSGTGDYDPGPSSFTLSTSSGNYDMFICKLDALGNFAWAKSVGTQSVTDYGYGITVDAGGDAYVAGAVFSTDDIYIARLNGSTGNFVWTHAYGSSGAADQAYGIALDNSNNVLVTGSYESLVDFDPGPGTFTMTTSNNYTNIFIQKFSQFNAPTITASSSTTFCAGESVTLTSSSASGYSWNNGPITQSINVTTSGNYYVTIYLASCAVSSSIVAVTANPLPTIAVNSGSICEGNSYTLVPSGASTYTFSSGPIVTPSVSTTYSVSGTSTAGCVSAFDGTALVTVNPIPTVAINNGSLCLGNSFTLNPTGANTYTYFPSGPVVSPIINSTYSVIGTSLAGCVSGNTAVCNLIVNSLPLPTVTVNSGTVCSGTPFYIVPSGAISYSYSTASNTIYPIVNTTYSVYGTDANGCISADPGVGTATAISLPTVIVNSGTLCPGKTFTMIPGGAISYTFSSGSATVAPSTTTNYVVYGSNSEGCIGSATSNVNVLPSPIISGGGGYVCLGKSFNITPNGAISYTIVPGGSGFVTPTVSTTYSINGTNSLGCISTTPALCNVAVFPLPTITVNSGSICLGKIFTITPICQYNYTIAGGSNTVSPVTSKSYTIITTDAFLCSNTATSNVNILPLPSISISSNQNPICTGKSATLTANGTQTFTWIPGNNTNTSVVTPFSSTNYSVSGTDNNGCSNTAVFTQSVDFCSGLKEINENISIGIIYPNPSNGEVTLEVNTEVDITITNMIGSVVYSSPISAQHQNLSLTHLPKGIYLVKLSGKDQKQILKLILD